MYDTFNTCVGYFTLPGIDTQKGPTAFSVSSERHWKSGVNELPKFRSEVAPVGIKPRTPRSQVLRYIHRVTAPGTYNMTNRV